MGIWAIGLGKKLLFCSSFPLDHRVIAAGRSHQKVGYDRAAELKAKAL
jgi:hypothetical protein